MPDERPRDRPLGLPILYFIGTLNIGGAERQLVEIATHLDRRFTPAVVCLSEGGALAADLERSGVPVFRVRWPVFRQARGLRKLISVLQLPGALWRLLSCARSHQPVVIHGFLLQAYVLGAAVGTLMRVPVVVASRRSLSNFKRHRPLLRGLEWMANRRTDLIVANSEAVRHDTLTSERLRPGDVIVIPNGVDPDHYERPPDDRLRASLGLRDGPVILVVANFIHYKGQGFFLEAWSTVCRSEPDAVALLAGDGPTRAACEADAHALGLSDRVRFLGTRRDIPDLLAVSTMLVHPSLEEGFSNAVLEAMAAGRPVVATDVGGNREAVIDGETGYLVPARDPQALAAAILKTLGSADRGRAMGQAGRQRVRAEFSRSVMVRRYEKTYLALLARRGVAR